MAQLTEMMDHSGNTITGRTSYLTTPDAQTDKIKVTVRLIELILKMSEAEQRNLIRELENIPIPETRKYAGEKRKHPREKCLIAVNCSSNDVLFTDFIQNINNGGVFIQTGVSFYVGQKITMEFSVPKAEDTITARGEVARLDSQGIGVKFINGDVSELDIKMQ